MADQYRCFSDDLDAAKVDRAGFKFHHQLLGHPALGLDNLGRVLPALPKGQVFYSSGLLKPEDDFDRAHIQHRNGLSLEETIENIRGSDSYIMVRSPETDPSFRQLFDDLSADVSHSLQRRGLPPRLTDARLYLFIASPNSLTPFHFDRYSTFLMQFRGSKQVFVFPPWDEDVISREHSEAFMAHAEGVRPPWKPELADRATGFAFAPGEAIHIPFVAGHYVKNGADDVSISMSIIYNSDETARQMRAMRLNHYLRKALRPVGLQPSRVGRSRLRDGAKAALWQAAARLAKVRGG